MTHQFRVKITVQDQQNRTPVAITLCNLSVISVITPEEEDMKTNLSSSTLSKSDNTSISNIVSDINAHDMEIKSSPRTNLIKEDEKAKIIPKGILKNSEKNKASLDNEAIEEEDDDDNDIIEDIDDHWKEIVHYTPIILGAMLIFTMSRSENVLVTPTKFLFAAFFIGLSAMYIQMTIVDERTRKKRTAIPTQDNSSNEHSTL